MSKPDSSFNVLLLPCDTWKPADTDSLRTKLNGRPVQVHVGEEPEYLPGMDYLFVAVGEKINFPLLQIMGEAARGRNVEILYAEASPDAIAGRLGRLFEPQAQA